MADLTPNDLSHLSDDAQAIVAAFDDRYGLLGPLKGNWEETCLTAALRARADHIRADILAIAAELENTDD